MELKEKAQAFAVKKALEYLDKDPETNLPKLIDWFEKFDVKGTLKKQVEIIRPVVSKLDTGGRQIMDGFKRRSL